MLSDGRVEDEKLPEETSRERDPCKRHHPDQHREGEEWRPFRETRVIVDLFSAVVSHDNKHGKTKQRHEQICDKIIGDRPSGKTDHANQQIARMGDAGIGEQPFEIRLRERGEITVDQGQGGDSNE
jgi:hypothetical protein